jgi:hypothetical protein
MSAELDAGDGDAAPAADVNAPTATEQHAAQSLTCSPAQATVEPGQARAIVLKVVLRGLCLDDPWRHAFLRNRWIGA